MWLILSDVTKMQMDQVIALTPTIARKDSNVSWSTVEDKVCPPFFTVRRFPFLQEGWDVSVMENQAFVEKP